MCPSNMCPIDELKHQSLFKKSLKIPKGGNQNLYNGEQTTQCSKEKLQKDKQ